MFKAFWRSIRTVYVPVCVYCGQRFSDAEAWEENGSVAVHAATCCSHPGREVERLTGLANAALLKREEVSKEAFRVIDNLKAQVAQAKEREDRLVSQMNVDLQSLTGVKNELWSVKASRDDHQNELRRMQDKLAAANERVKLLERVMADVRNVASAAIGL